MKYPGLGPRAEWGAPNVGSLSTWVPLSDRREEEHQAILAARALDGANDSRGASDIAWCANLNLDDDGAVWREAVNRGRTVEGGIGDLRKCAERHPRELEIERDELRTEYEAEPYGPSWIVLHVPDRGGDDVAHARDELYATARGSLCTAFGPPLSNDEKALDALAASLVTSRGTNGAGLGWDPPEPELLKEAGRELQRSPERLQDLVNRVGTIERQLYPPWEQRERGLEHYREMGLQHNLHDPLNRERGHYSTERVPDSREPLRRERGRYSLEVWHQRQKEAHERRLHRVPAKKRDRKNEPDPRDKPVPVPGPERDPDRPPTREPRRPPVGDPRRPPAGDPPHTNPRYSEPPPPERGPTPNHDRPREHDRGLSR